MLYMSFIVYLCIIPWPTVTPECCSNLHSYCPDCYKPSRFECCGKTSCNIFCCNCECRRKDLCALNCMFGNSTRHRRAARSNFESRCVTSFRNAEEVMAQLDSTRDGVIDVEEMVNWFAARCNIPLEYIIHAFKEIDKNDNRVLTIEEVDASPRRSLSMESGAGISRKQKFHHEFYQQPKKRSVRSTRHPTDHPTNKQQHHPTPSEQFSLLSHISKTISPKFHKLSDSCRIGIWMSTSESKVGNMCSVEIVIEGNSRNTRTFKKPDLSRYECKIKDGYHVMFDARLLDARQTYQESLEYPKEDRIRRISIETIGYTDLLLSLLCFVLDKKASGRGKSSSICLDHSFFNACISLGYGDSGHRLLLNGDDIKFTGSPRGAAGIEINEVQEFVHGFATTNFSESGDSTTKVMRSLCESVKIINRGQCYLKTVGCPIEEKNARVRNDGMLLNPKKCTFHAKVKSVF